MSSPTQVAAEKLAAIDRYLPRFGPLADVNRTFHQMYELLVGEVLARLRRESPVIVAIDDDLKLLNDGQEHSARFIPEAYHQLKAVSHVAFGVQLALAANGEGSLSEPIARRLEAMRDRVQAAEAHLPAEHLPDEVQESSAAVLRLSRTVIANVLSANTVQSEVIAQFGREVSPWLAMNVACATRLELEHLHQIVIDWRSEIGDRWRESYVVICEGHQPRYRQATKQYFQRLLHEVDGLAAELEDRVIYAEGVSDVAVALDLLARHIIDQEASRVFFGDRRRLQEDLLADAAAIYVDELLSGDE